MNGGLARYLLDADVFIEAARRYYAFDIAPGFWNGLIQHAQTGMVLSIDRVKNEIDVGNDYLKTWANSAFNLWFASTNVGDVVNTYGRIMQWASVQNQFTNAAKAEFASADNADAWLVAYALVNSCVVVTEEKFDSNIHRKIPLPNVCNAFGIQHLDTFKMLRVLGVKLS